MLQSVESRRPPELRQTLRASFLFSLFSEHVEREVVPGADLDAVVVIRPAVSNVFPPAPLEFRTSHQVLYGVIHEIEDAVVAALKGTGWLQDGVADIDHRVSDRGTELLAVSMVEECDYAEHRKFFARERTG